MARSRRLWPSKAARLWAGLGLLLAWSGLEAGDGGEGQGEVAAGPIVGAPPIAPAVQDRARARLLAALAGLEPVGLGEEDPGGAEPPRPTRPARPPATVVQPAAPAELGPAPVIELPPPVRRRDPVEPPFLERDGWQEWVVAVLLNDEAVTTGAIVLRDEEDRFAIRLADLRAWRVRVDEDAVITFEGEPFYPLDELPGAQLAFHPAELVLELDLPPALFDPHRIAPPGFEVPPPVAARGGFLDYDVQYQAGDGMRPRLDGLFEAGVFSEHGVLVSNLRAIDLGGDDRSIERLETTFIRDVPERRASLRVGDSLTAGGAFGRPTRFGGLQWTSNFATDPAFVTFPLPTIGGLAEQASVVEVLIDNAARLSERVPPGPFELESLPVVSGRGEVQLRVTDLLGRERWVTQSYYVTPRLLREGLSEFAYQAGFLRERFGDHSFDYGDAVAAGLHRYGLTDALTLEGYAELRKRQQMAAVGATGLLGTFGVLGAGIGISRDDDAGRGVLARLDYEFQAAAFSLGARTTYAGVDFRQIGTVGLPRRVDQANVGFRLGEYGSLGLLLVHRDERGAEDRLTLSGNYGVRIGPGSFLLSAVRSFEPSRDLAVTATYALPLGGDHHLATQGFARDGDRSGRVQLSRARGTRDLGLTYRVAAEGGDRPTRLDGMALYDARYASGRLDLSHRDGDTRMRANLSGSIAHIDGRTRLSRRLGRAFGLVSLPGFPDVRVYLENREVGRTDADGVLLVPGLRPYEANRLRVELADLPLEAEVGSTETIAVPFERSGVAVDLPIRRAVQAVATLLDEDGRPLEAGLVLESADGLWHARVGRDGLAYVTGEGAGPATLVARNGRRAHRCTIAPGEPLADLGSLTCVTDS